MGSGLSQATSHATAQASATAAKQVAYLQLLNVLKGSKMRSLFIFVALLGLSASAHAGDYLPPQLARYPLPTQVVSAAPVRQYDCSSGQCRPVSNYSELPNSSTAKRTVAVPVANAPYLPPCPCQTQQGGCPCAVAPQPTYQAPQATYQAPQVSGSCSSFGAGSCGASSQRRVGPIRAIVSGVVGLFGGCGG
jgi:hypothetical protein